MAGDYKLSHSGCCHGLPLLLFSLATLFCPSNAAFPISYPKRLPTATRNAFGYPSPFVLQHHTRSGHDQRNHPWLFAASRDKTAKTSRSDIIATAIAIPHGGETANNGTPDVEAPNMTYGECEMKPDEPRQTGMGEASGTEKVVRTTLRIHLYLAAMYESIRNPSLRCQILSGESNEWWLVCLMPVLGDVASTDDLRLILSLLLAVSVIELTVLRVHFKSLNFNNVLLLIPVVISFCVVKK